MSGRVLWLTSILGGTLVLLWCLLALPSAASQPFAAQSVIISEVAWSGTAAGSSHEWLELYNSGDAPVDLTGWSLWDSDLLAPLGGVIQPNEFHVVERNEFVLIDIAADHFLVGTLEDEGETIQLVDARDGIVDTANAAGEAWPAGTAGPVFLSMERVHPLAHDEPAGWVSNDGLTRNGLDSYGQAVNGTPGMPNSAWVAMSGPDLSLQKAGPAEATAGGILGYVLTVSNTGQAMASSVIVTDTLPPATSFAAHDGQFPLTMPLSNTLVWQVGDLVPGTNVSIKLTTTVEANFAGVLTNTAEAKVVEMETSVLNNSVTLVTSVSLPEPLILIDAVYYDGYEDQDLDEAVRLFNAGGSTQDLSGWRLSDGLHEATFPSGVTLGPSEGIWIADWAVRFRRQFGHDPDYEVRGSALDVPNLEGTWPGFGNTGDEVLLRSPEGHVQDVLVYEDGNTFQEGWNGPALEPYTLAGVFAAEGQILYRSHTGPRSRMPDTDTSVDWAQSTYDAVNGRRVRYPGWDLDDFQSTGWFTETADLVIGIAPDNAFDMLQAELAGAQSELRIASHTFRSAALKEELIAALDRGVTVTVLLEGQPVGGMDSAQRANCQELENAGGQCWFMINNPEQDIYDRYRYLHAKFILVDDRRAIISTENLSPDSYPNDDKSDGTWGRRGVVIATDASSIVSLLLTLWERDLDPLNHLDLAPWSAVEMTLESIPIGDVQLNSTIGLTYSVRYTEPARFNNEFAFVIAQSPENALGSRNGLLHLLSRADSGDTVLVEQLSERPHWGAAGSDASRDPNPRLEALIDAARRGAKVRLLLDDFFDDGNSLVSNLVTCQYANQTAVDERLDLRCEQANPTGLGLHNKMVLAEIDGSGYVFVGSINGTELSNKGNREVAILIQSDEAYALLADMFTRDWPHLNVLPLVFKEYVGPARHILISEVLYDPPGSDDAEFIELFNPTPQPLDISGYSIGDALYMSDFEDVRHFPEGTILSAGKPLIVAVTSTGFYAQFGLRPDFEILDSDLLVPDLLDNEQWGDPSAFLQLGNSGDEVIVRDRSGLIVEAIAYGSGQIFGNVTCPLNTIAGAVLERYPPWKDTDDCPADFREWPFPNPGQVP